MRSYIRWFREIRLADVPLVGGKNASLGELYSELTEAGVRVPNGFAITADAYTALLETNGLHDQMARLLKGLSGEDLPALAEVGAALRRLVAEAPLPPGLEDDVVAAYRTLCREYGPGLAVAVRSSATAEDLPEASFAGLHETYLGVRGDSALLTACRRCFASLFTDRAIAYRIHQGFDHLSVRLSVGVQKMVRADRGAAGVMFTLDPESGFRDVVLINSAYGFGEAVVGGQINPDEFWIFKPTLGTGYHAILKRVLGRKEWKLVSADGGATARVEVPPEARLAPSLSDPEALELAGYAVAIEAHYSRKFQRPTPMDVEWAKDGEDGRLYILQARPETVHRAERPSVIEVFTLGEAPVRQRLVAGKAIGEKIGVGRARRLLDPRFLDRFRPGEVLVTPMTDPDWEPIMKRAAAIVTDRGGRTCFAGETKILTSRGFRTMEELYEASGDLLVPSLNRQTLKIEWKPILRVVKRRAPVIEVSTSLTGRQDTNTLRLTPDHKMVAVQGRQLVDREITRLLDEHEHIFVAGRVPCLGDATVGGRLPAYLVGALSTDGHVRLTGRRGAVTFIQKPTAEKEAFIAAVVDGMTVAHGKEPSISEKPVSSGTIRGKPARGTANAYRWHRKQIAADLLWEQERMVETLLASPEDAAYDFLAGVVDGDGAYSSGVHRIGLYCSNPALMEAIVVASLRVGILPQVTRNRNIANIQLVEGLEEIGRRTRRVKVQGARRRVGTRFFAARSLLADIVGEVNAGGHIRPYVENNLLIGADKIAELLPEAPQQAREELGWLLGSNLRQHRVTFRRDLGEHDVYNLTVSDNHNYIVFSDLYSPVLVNNCHAAIVSRELGVPCLVGTERGSQVIPEGEAVTVSCCEGETGYVYRGAVPFDRRQVDLAALPKPATAVMLNVGNPDEAFRLAALPNEGVGLARIEFIIASAVKVHPLALLHPDRVRDPEARAAIDALTRGYGDRAEYFVDRLAEGVAVIAAAFYPKDVIVRLSDFKSNEYAGLIGGRDFEPEEENPMLGFRGAFRYCHPRYRDGFALECRAMRRVREDMGLTNVKLMIPFCRTPEEGRRVLELMARHGLSRGERGLEVYVMCEIPSNVILAREFAGIFDGFSIGSNDLTQLVLGLDRDSELVAPLFDERNPAVLAMVGAVIDAARSAGRKIGICGQAPSDYPDFTRFLVQRGIDSISLNPDALVQGIQTVLDAERSSEGGSAPLPMPPPGGCAGEAGARTAAWVVTCDD